jgi:hypothetical protein
MAVPVVNQKRGLDIIKNQTSNKMTKSDVMSVFIIPIPYRLHISE